ncbi:hypothetical protein Tco_1314731 [Tanacetum coccineum]
MDDYMKKALWNYWTRGDDEVELTDEESSDSDDEDEVAKIFRIETNALDFMCKDFKEFNYLLQIDPDLLIVPCQMEFRGSFPELYMLLYSSLGRLGGLGIHLHA